MSAEQYTYILGGGPAGLSAAYYAQKNNMPFHLFESSSQFGGNCRTLAFKEFLFDTGAHRFHNKNKEATELVKELLGNDLRLVTSPSKIFWNNKYIEFPIDAKDILRQVGLCTNLNILFDKITNQFRGKSKVLSFKESSYHKYGQTLADMFLINYTEKLWGEKADNLCPTISGGRLKNLNLLSVIRSFFLSKNVDVEHLDGSFLYPKYGFGTIFDSISQSLAEDSVSLNSPISNLIYNKSKIESIVFNDGMSIDGCDVKNIISTLPVSFLIKCLYPRVPVDIINAIDGLKYRNLRLFVFFLDTHKFSDNASIYFPQSDVPFTRIYEPKNRSKNMAPKDKTCIVVEMPYDSEASKDEIDQYNIDYLKKILVEKKLLSIDIIIDSIIVDIPYAYPVITTDIQSRLDKVSSYLNRFKNLHVVGRSADFNYLHVHDLLMMSKNIISKINKVSPTL